MTHDQETCVQVSVTSFWWQIFERVSFLIITF